MYPRPAGTSVAEYVAFLLGLMHCARILIVGIVVLLLDAIKKSPVVTDPRVSIFSPSVTDVVLDHSLKSKPTKFSQWANDHTAQFAWYLGTRKIDLGTEMGTENSELWKFRVFRPRSVYTDCGVSFLYELFNTETGVKRGSRALKFSTASALSAQCL